MRPNKVLAAVMSAALVSTATLGYLPQCAIGTWMLRAKAAETDDGWLYEEWWNGIAITGYEGDATDLIVPDEIDGQPVVQINDEAFHGCRTVTSIDLANVEYIGSRAFMRCTNLKTITIPNTVTGMGSFENGVFEGSSVETVIFEEGIEAIPDYACMNADSVQTVVIPEKQHDNEWYDYYIGNYAFYGTSISEINLQNSTHLGFCLFDNCVYLTNITIPNTVTDMGCYDAGALEGSFIETVTFEEGIKNIPVYACMNAVHVKSVSIPERTGNYDSYSIGNYAFAGTAITEINLQNATRLGCYLFESCDGLKSITIPNTVEETGYHWGGCLDGSSIETVVFEEGIENIPSYVCSGAEHLKNVTIPEKVNIWNGYSIGERAFKDTAISEFDLKNVTEIGAEAFSDCENLSEITLPETLTSLGRCAFENTAIQEITIPKYVTYADAPFSGSSLKTIVFEEGIENIPEYVCFEAAKVENVVIPEKRYLMNGYTIGERAFEGTAISEINLANVTKIDYRAFANCNNLVAFDIPQTVAYLGNEIFADSKNLREFTIPNQALEIGSWGALNSSFIETLYIADGIQSVPAYFAKGAEHLRTVYLPDSVTELGDWTFADCVKLSKINYSKDSVIFYPDTFRGCISLKDSRFTVFDWANTSLIANTAQVNVNGLIHYTLKYKLNPAVAAASENYSIRLNVPYGVTMLMDSMQCKGFNINHQNDDCTYLEVDSPEGELRFSVRVVEIGDYEVEANLGFDFGKASWDMLIGKSTVDCPDLTFTAAETVSSPAVTIHGISQFDEDITVYVNGEPAETFTANEYTGRYTGVVTLPEGEDGDTYTLYAECCGRTTPVVTTTYSDKKPVVQQVIFKYNQHSDIQDELDITDVLTSGYSPVVSFNPTYPMQFDITASHSDKIEKMLVTSTKGREVKYMEAFYQEDTGLWVARGYFDNDYTNYVPGSLNITLIEKETVLLPDEHDYTQDNTLADLPQEYIDNSSVEIISETDTAVLADIHVSDGQSIGNFLLYSEDNADGAVIDGTFYSVEEIAQSPEKYGYRNTGVQSVENGHVATYYARDFSLEDAGTQVNMEIGDKLKSVADLWTGKSILTMVEGEFAENPGVQLVNKCITTKATEALDKITDKYYGNIGKTLTLSADLVRYWNQLSMTDNANLQTTAAVLFGLKCFNTLGGQKLLFNAVLGASLAASPLAFVFSFEIGWLLNQADSYLMECIENNSEFTLTGFIHFIIDPSGMVYEAVIGNPVTGATMTIYFYNPETGESIQWNAEDFDQHNPIATDAEGRYLWDVPEGLWKVVCEKEGYETVETEWMDVPPVRTDVNLSLVCKDVPTVESVTADEDAVTVKFSKFMDIATVTPENLIVSAFSGNYTITPTLLNEDDLYADTFVLNGDLTENIVTVNTTENLLSYCGTPAQAEEQTAYRFEMSGTIFAYGEESEITMQLFAPETEMPAYEQTFFGTDEVAYTLPVLDTDTCYTLKITKDGCAETTYPMQFENSAVQLDITLYPNRSYAHSVSFENNLSVNYYVSAEDLDEFQNVRLCAAKQTPGTTPTDEYLEGVCAVYDANYGHEYRFEYLGVAAKEAVCDIYAYLTGEKDGFTYRFNQDTYSVKKYCYNQISKTTNTKFKTLLVDLLNYCSAAQVHFNYQSDNLVNKDLTDTQKAYGTTTDPAIGTQSATKTLTDAAAKITAKSLIFGNNVEMKFYMNLESIADKSKTALKISYQHYNFKTKRNETITDTILFSDFGSTYSTQYGTEYTATCTKFVAADFRTPITVVVLNNGKEISDTITYSVETYCYNILQKSTSQDSMKNLAISTIKYSDSAYAYLESKS